MKFNIISLSDIHLGNRLVSAESIIYGLNKLLPDVESMANVSAIFLAGDIFDESLLLSDNDVIPIQLWIVRLLKLCAKWDIILRVLEGTPKHDRTQSKQFDVFKTALGVQVDFKYVDILSIEYIEKYNVNILYVPDEWRGTTKETELEVQELLIHHNLKQVEIAVMHGHFQYQLPYLGVDSHSEEFYHSVVKYLIFIGHIHTMSQSGIIRSHGSTDCISHNSESPKGVFKVSIDLSTGDSKTVFIINEWASIFKSIDISSVSGEIAEERIKRTLDKLFVKLKGIGKIHVQLKVKRNQHQDLIKGVKMMWEPVVWTTKIKDENIKTIETNFSAPTTFKSIPINKNTITGIISERIATGDTEAAIKEKALRILGNIIQ